MATSHYLSQWWPISLAHVYAPSGPNVLIRKRSNKTFPTPRNCCHDTVQHYSTTPYTLSDWLKCAVYSQVAWCHSIQWNRSNNKQFILTKFSHMAEIISWIYNTRVEGNNFFYIEDISMSGWQYENRIGTLGLIWRRHQTKTFSALLAICAGNSPVTGEFPAQRPVTRSFDVFFDLRLNKRLSKQSWGWWFETSSRSLWRHSNEQNTCTWHFGDDNFKYKFLVEIVMLWLEFHWRILLLVQLAIGYHWCR